MVKYNINLEMQSKQTTNSLHSRNLRIDNREHRRSASGGDAIFITH